jgi:hypothetical protein
MAALALRLDAWSPMMRDRDAHILLAPILALAADENGTPLLPIDPVKDAAMLDTAHDMIPPAVVAIRQFWRSQEPLPAAPRIRTPNETVRHFAS